MKVKVLQHFLNFCLLFLCVRTESLANFEFPSQNLYHQFLDTKADLARSLFKKEISQISSHEVVNLTHTAAEELVVPGDVGSTTRIFRSADENFLYAGGRLLQLQKNDSTQSGRYSLQAVHDVRIDEGAVFFKNMEWQNKVFLVICYQKGYCEVRVSAPFAKENLKLKINTEVLPLDITFFGTHEDLFLVMVLDPVVIFRWTGTFFNEVHRLDTTGAQSVAVFEDAGNLIVVVAQNLGVNKVFSKVYLKRNDQIELFQLLPTKEALRVLPFSLFHGDEKLYFIFALNNENFSQIFWWTKKEFVPWTTLDNVHGQRIVYIGKIGSQNFFFISDKNKVYVYHPSVTSFDLMQIILFDGDVIGLDLRQEKGQLPMLVVLTGSPMDPYTKINLIFLKVVHNYIEVEKENSEELFECLKALNEELESRSKKLKNLEVPAVEGEAEELKKLPSEQIDDMLLNPLQNSVEEVMSRIEIIEDRWAAVQDQVEEISEGKRYFVKEDLVIDNMNAELINAAILNEIKSVNFNNFLSLTEDQTFLGEIVLDTLSTDELDVPSIYGIAVEDLLLKNKEVQRIQGNFYFSSMSAEEIKFGPTGTLNGIPFVDIITNENSNQLIKGSKTFTKLKANQVEVDKINNIPAEEWLARVLPKVNEASEEKPLNFTDLTVDSLWVYNLNGIPWNDFLHSTYLLEKEPIEGNLTVMGKAIVENLVTSKINDVLVASAGNQSKFICESAKIMKSLPFGIDLDYDDSLIKDILNEPESEYENDVLYFPEDGKIEGPIYAAQIFVKNPIKLSGTLVNLENITERFWMANQNQTIEVPVTFTRNITVTNTLSIDTINGNSLDSFVRIDSPNSDLPAMVFEEAEIEGNVNFAENVKHNVNLKNLNSEVVEAILDEISSGRQQTLKRLSTRTLTVNTLNKVHQAEFSDVVKASLEMTERLNVSEVVFDEDLTVENGVAIEKLNDYNFEDTVSSILTLDDPDLLEKANFKVLTVENLEVDTINGINLEEKLPRLSRHPQNDIFFVIEGDLKVPQMNVNTINGIKFDDFTKKVFLKNKSKTIKGKIAFKEAVTVTGNFQGNLNSFNVTELEATALSKTKPQTITATYTVENYRANDVDVNLINGVSTDGLIFQNVSTLQTINSDVVFNNIAVAGDILADDFMNDCNLKELTDVDVKNLETFNTLDVWGDVSWDPNGKRGTLSDLLDNVVTVDGDQVITGSVAFENDLLVRDVNGSRYINDVDLRFIAKDAVFKSHQDKYISTPVTIKGNVRADRIEIKGNVLVNTIGNVDVTDIDERLVRKSVDTVVTGRKIFKNGFSASHFNTVSVNGDKTDQIIFYNNLINVKTNLNVTFKNLNVAQDLTVKWVNGYDLNDLVRNRLSKTKNQSFYGKVKIEGDVFIEGDVDADRINDVNVSETVLANGEYAPQVITGDIIFNDSVSIDGKLEVDYINGQNISALYENAILVDEDVVLDESVDFLEGATVDGHIQINDNINSCDINKATSIDQTDSTEEKINHRFREALRAEVDTLTNISSAMSKPVIFSYLEEAATLDLRLPSMHSSVVNFYNDSTEINVYGMNTGQCGLPSDCYCPTQVNLFFKSLQSQLTDNVANKSRFFKYYDPELEIELMVITSSVSYSARCMKHEGDQEHTSVSWRNLQTSETYYEVNLETGFLSDVKFFRLGESIYIVMAFYFDPLNKQTNNLYTMVYEFKNMNLTKIDQIPSSGVQVLEVFWTTTGVVLVVGNSFDSDRFTDSVNSGIYRFNEFENKFELLRFVKTHGIMSIKGIRHKKTSFIFFVQKQSWPLLILKYNQEFDNYYFSQKLDTARSMIRSNFLSVSVVSTSSTTYPGDILIGIVLSDDSFRLFKYKHIEGFVEESYQEQNNVRILQPFWAGGTRYLLAGSASDTSRVYKFVEQGRN